MRFFAGEGAEGRVLVALTRLSWATAGEMLVVRVPENARESQGGRPRMRQLTEICFRKDERTTLISSSSELSSLSACRDAAANLRWRESTPCGRRTSCSREEDWLISWWMRGVRGVVRVCKSRWRDLSTCR